MEAHLVAVFRRKLDKYMKIKNFEAFLGEGGEIEQVGLLKRRDRMDSMG